MIRKKIMDLLATMSPKMPDKIRDRRKTSLKKEINAILTRQSPAQTRRAEADFSTIQQRSRGHGEPDYFSPRNCWKRAAQRSISLLDIIPFEDQYSKILEVGCGDGMTSYILSSYGHSVIISDLEDWRDTRCRSLEFIQAPLEEKLPLPNASFDFIFSFEAFEHFADPAKCLRELKRLCRSGGIIHLNFGPLYASPWGLHAYGVSVKESNQYNEVQALKMPYPQFLFSEAFLSDKLADYGIWDLGRKLSKLQPLNRWKLQQFLELWSNDNYEIIDIYFHEQTECLPYILEYPEAFSGRELTYEDVITQSIVVTLRRI